MAEKGSKQCKCRCSEVDQRKGEIKDLLYEIREYAVDMAAIESKKVLADDLDEIIVSILTMVDDL